LEFTQAERIDDIGWPSVIARLKLEGGILNVIGTHPLPPGGRELSWSRDQQLQAVARRAAACEGAVMLLGDLNVTSWSPIFADLLNESGLRDSRRGHGLQPTWPTDNIVLRIPIDHCLVSPGVFVHRRWIGQAVGSDHFPVFVEISLAK
jgi:endonuclease/exonuclease/phosphatase (EEP) superfamily protein YafD